MEELLHKILGELTNLRQGQEQTNARLENLEAGQAKLEARQAKLEAGQDELKVEVRKNSVLIEGLTKKVDIVGEVVQANFERSERQYQEILDSMDREFDLKLVRMQKAK